MKLWKYIYYNESTHSVDEGKTEKSGFVWSDNAPDIDYEDVTTQEALENMLFSDYLKRKEDGVNYFLKMVSSLMLMVGSGSLNQLQAKAIEDELRPVRNELVLGQWLSAKIEMESINISVVSQSLYDQIYSYINQYISENY